MKFVSFSLPIQKPSKIKLIFYYGRILLFYSFSFFSYIFRTYLEVMEQLKVAEKKGMVIYGKVVFVSLIAFFGTAFFKFIYCNRF